MAANKNKKPANVSTAEKVAGVISKYRIVLITIIALAVAGLICLAVVNGINSKQNKKDLEVIYTIEKELVEDAAGMSEAELQAKYEKAIESLQPFTSKGGIVGARAEMLSADVLLRQKKFEAARDSYVSAAKKAKGSYITGLCYFNAAVACEELNDNEKALEYYTLAANDKEFADPTHAWFSVGRIKEISLDYIGAKEAYDEIISRNNSDDPWFNYAKDRVLQMQIDGKIE